MIVRLLADREPYASYAKKRDPTGSLFFLTETTEAGSDRADIEVMPAERFIALPPRLRPQPPVFAYGPVSLMAAAYEAGCFDYLRDPWSLAELKARAKRLDILHFFAGETELELRGSRLSVRGGAEGSSVTLNETERKLLRLLARNAGMAVSRRAIALELCEKEGCGRTTDVHVARLRAKIGLLAPGGGTLITACRCLGYRFDNHPCG
jgi:DNA-binding winged helix-turn-helix (wHTH) protein